MPQSALPFPCQEKKKRTPQPPPPPPPPQNKKELSKPVLEEQAQRKAAHMPYNAAPPLTSAITLATIAESHSTVTGEDCQGPGRTIDLYCPDQGSSRPSTLCPATQEPHLNPSPLSSPVPCCGVGLCPALSSADTDSLSALPRLTIDPHGIWHLSDDHQRVNFNCYCQHLCPAQGQRDWALSTRIPPFPSCGHTQLLAGLLLLLPDKDTYFHKR